MMMDQTEITTRNTMWTAKMRTTMEQMIPNTAIVNGSATETWSLAIMQIARISGFTGSVQGWMQSQLVIGCVETAQSCRGVRYGKLEFRLHQDEDEWRFSVCVISGWLPGYWRLFHSRHEQNLFTCN